MVSKAAMAIAAIGCLFEGLSGLPQRRRSVKNRRPLSDAKTGDFEFRIGSVSAGRLKHSKAALAAQAHIVA